MAKGDILAARAPEQYLIDAGTGDALGATDVALVQVYDRPHGKLYEPIPAASLGAHSPGGWDTTVADDVAAEVVAELAAR